MDTPFSTTNLHRLAWYLYPHGLADNGFLPIVVENKVIQLRILIHVGMGDDVQFLLHHENAMCARRNFLVFADGALQDVMYGPVPPHDQLAGEVALASSNEAIAHIIYETLLEEQARRLASRANHAPTVQP